MKELLVELLYGKPLSTRELQVLERAARGETSEETAAALHLSPETVKSYRKNTIAKLGARNLHHAIALAIRHGQLSVDDVEPDFEPGGGSRFRDHSRE